MEYFGLDFGTTNSSLAWAKRDGSVALCPLDPPAMDANVLRSLLYFSLEQRDFVVGHRAIEEYLAEDMQGRMMQSIKTFLADDLFEQTFVHDRFYTLEDLIAVVFRHVHRSIRTLTNDAAALVIGRPAVFVDRPEKEGLAQSRLRRAAHLAGFFEIDFQYEPIAAGLAYEMSLEQPEIALIADFGGGTSDFTVMRLGAGSRGDRRQDILATGGVQIAGDSFSAAIMQNKLLKYFGAGSTYRSMEGNDLPFPSQLLANLSRWHYVAFLRSRETREQLRRLHDTCSQPEAVTALEDLIEGNSAFFLFQAIEKAKSELSEQEATVVRFDRDDILIEEPITREEFESFTARDRQRIGSCMHAVLNKAGVDRANVQAVFMTGGTAQIPAIRQMFEHEFGPEKLKSRDYLTSVAVGLGVTAQARLRLPNFGAD